MATTETQSFIIDGDEKAGYLPVALDKAIDYLREKTGLTLTVSDVTIERNPHGSGMWNYTIKVIKHE
jgi:hypothetical protein